MSDYWGMLPEEWTNTDLQRLKGLLRSHGMQDWCAEISYQLMEDGMPEDEAEEEAEHRWHTIMGTGRLG